MPAPQTGVGPTIRASKQTARTEGLIAASCIAGGPRRLPSFDTVDSPGVGGSGGRSSEERQRRW